MECSRIFDPSMLNWNIWLNFSNIDFAEQQLFTKTFFLQLLIAYFGGTVSQLFTKRPRPCQDIFHVIMQEMRTN